jgi:AraC-like DNA-binding protein
MYRATQLLRENRKLSDVAQLIGYASDGAFHRAFRRVIGVSPGTYRRGLN